MSGLPIGRIRIPRQESDMRVPDYILKCVGFVAECVDGDAESVSYDPIGTGFFVNVTIPGTPRYYMVFVTARHVASDMQSRETVLLVNKKGGGVVPLTDFGDSWFTHPDESVDVAVLPVNPDLALHEIRSIPIDMFLSDEELRANHIGIGDEVYLPGLFAYIANAESFTPILRHGNISMMSGVPIQIDTGYAEVHLIEARSIGGISGSPVFVRGTVALTNKANQCLQGLSGKNYLFGLIHGHWDIRESDINNPRYATARLHGVNIGIAVVVPAMRILEALLHPGLLEIWAKREEQIRQAVTPEPDQA